MVTVEIGGSRDRAQHDGSRAEASGSGSAADDPESENEPWRLPRFEKLQEERTSGTCHS